MNAISLAPSFIFSSTSPQSPPYIGLLTLSTRPNRYCYMGNRLSSSSLLSSSNQSQLLHSRQLPVSATLNPDEGVVAVVDFKDLAEKDWSILDTDETNSKEERERKWDRVISVGNIGETSKVLVSLGSDDFVDRLVDTSPCQFLLVAHDSLFLLAGIKERHDKVKCWQGELIYVPEKWAPFDAVFLYFLPALPFKLDEVFGALTNRCSPGARVVISHLEGKQALENQRLQYPDIVVSNLPDKMILEKVANDHSFVINEFVDEPGFFLAVLELKA
ncbi:hypothetical protein Nepgr_020577 [Nepenthes gracilis]|uniref:Uncharacterized protein n=1 Tax=Nepenthes gracilis TaxID=150966 RepID=A0AAD3XWI3_NEPGR|nr:hypothetical protein Nepgr_020577 [Nepenthes gracilis]